MCSSDTHSRILVVDDIITNAAMLQEFLVSRNYLVAVAHDGKEAIAKTASFNPDLILTDVVMPRMNGFELCRILKKDKRYRHIPIVFLTGLTDTKTRLEGLKLGAEDFITKPFDLAEVQVRVRNLLLIKKYQDDLLQAKATLEQNVRERTRELQNVVNELQKAKRSVEQAHYDSVFRLSVAAEFRDNETGNHVKRMSRYSALLAKAAGLSRHKIELILNASPMHDVGKLGIPDAILRKPGKLTREEFAVMRRHSEIGAKILSGSNSELLQTAATIAISHHEKFDGSGYPYGLKGEQIPLVGRMVAIADVFDALMSRRVYKPAFSLDKTVNILLDSAGSHLDPELTTLFIGRLDAVQEIMKSFPDTQEVHSEETVPGKKVTS
jgi:putative two-component system response regulator